jgi:hypothetical protein
MWGIDSNPNPDKTNEKWSEFQRKQATNGNGPHLRGKIVNFDVTKSCRVIIKTQFACKCTLEGQVHRPAHATQMDSDICFLGPVTLPPPRWEP